MKKRNIKRLLAEIVGCLTAFVIFVVPFLFMLTNSLKDRKAANSLKLSFPEAFAWSNYAEVVQQSNYQLMTAFKNSGLMTLGGVIVLIICGAMAGFVIQRRRDRLTKAANALLMVGLMLPAAIMPTIWLLQGMNIYKTMFSMVLIEAALNMPFTIMLYRGFVGTIPRELEEAGLIDGCSKLQIFSKIIMPLLKPVTATAIILNAVTIFNDFTNPLYFFPGSKNITVQLTLYSYMGQYSSSYNLLFADVILIVLPMLVLFLFFNKRIISGMVAGAVKG